MLETNFENEAANSEHMAALVVSEPRLRDRVYIPRVYHDLSTKVRWCAWGHHIAPCLPSFCSEL